MNAFSPGTKEIVFTLGVLVFLWAAGIAIGWLAASLRRATEHRRVRGLLLLVHRFAKPSHTLMHLIPSWIAEDIHDFFQEEAVDG